MPNARILSPHHPVLTEINKRLYALEDKGLVPRCIILGQDHSREVSDLLLDNFQPLPPDTELFGLPIVTVFHDTKAIQVGI